MSDYYSRKFLNKKRGIASIEVVGEVPSSRDLGERYFTDASVTISDCHRQVTLDFYLDSKYSRKDIQSQLDKLDTLIGELTKFRTWLHENNPNNS
jgi:hypothetical protein